MRNDMNSRRISAVLSSPRRKPVNVVAVIRALILLLPFFGPYAIISRGWNEFWGYGWPMFLFTSVTACAHYVFNSREKPRKQQVLTALLFLPVGYLTGVLFYSIAIWMGDTLSALARITLNMGTLRYYVICPVVILLGAALFYFRLRLRSIYGATEALAGIGVVLQQVKKFNETTPEGSTPSVELSALPPELLVPPELFIPLLTAGVYLIVRGLDNVHQGLTKEPYDRAALWILAWLRDRRHSEKQIEFDFSESK